MKIKLPKPSPKRLFFQALLPICVLLVFPGFAPVPGAYSSRIVGLAGWTVVAAGLFAVALGCVLNARPKRRPEMIRLQVDPNPPEKMVHSQEYPPPPHRRLYRSSRRRV